VKNQDAREGPRQGPTQGFNLLQMSPNFRGGPREQAFHNNIKSTKAEGFFIQMAEEVLHVRWAEEGSFN